MEQYKVFDSFIDAYTDTAKEHHEDITKELTNFYLEVNRFMKLYELFDADIYRMFVIKTENDVSINLFCLDPSHFLKQTVDDIKGAVFFSATLSPVEYYIDTLGGSNEDDGYLLLPSPFPQENFKLIVAPKVSIRQSLNCPLLPEINN